MPEEKPMTLLVLGGGNGAHTLAALSAAWTKMEIRVLTLYADEAERWSKAVQEKGITVAVTYNDQTTGTVCGKPNLITKDPAIAVQGADIIFFVVPAFAHQQYFNAIVPYIHANTIIVGMPGQAGFEFQALAAFKQRGISCAILSLESLPWACRIEKFGTDVQVLGFKESLGCSMILGTGNYKTDPIQVVQKILGTKPKVKQTPNYLAVNLMAKSIIHPPVMYGRWKDWDGTPMKEKPLFYQGVDDVQEQLLTGVSNEVVAVAQEIQKRFPNMDMSDVIGIHDWYKKYYNRQVTDDSTLKSCMRTNKAYDGLVHPMKEEAGGLVPDFSYRYTAEDIPYGLVVMKGIAQLAGVKTPVIDEVIGWCQEKLGKTYVIGSELNGTDVKFTRAPQAYGFTTIEELCCV